MKDKFSILILGAFNLGALEHNFVRGFQHLGHQVHCLDIQTPVLENRKTLLDKIYFKILPTHFYIQINKTALELTQKLRPDVILIFKGMELFVETIEELQSYTKLLCNYNPDHPLEIYSEGAGNTNILNSLKFYDIHFSYAQNITKKLQLHTNKLCYTVPFGYDENLVNQYSKHINRQLNQNFFAFIGAYDNERAKKLSLLQNPHLNIYGNSEWKNRNPFNNYLQKHFQQKALYHQEYAQISANSLGVLNFLRHQNLVEHSHNMRTFEVPAFGGLLIADRTEEQQEFFEENKEAIFFNNIDELKEKLLFLHQNTANIPKMKQAALKRSINSGYSYLDRSKKLLDIFMTVLLE